MKKYIIFTALLFTVMFSFAAEPKRFGDARRFIEVGTNVQLGGGNNYYGLGDFFQETLVIDFNEIATELGEDGLTLGLGTNVDLYSNINFKNFGFGFFTDVDANVSSSIPKSIFELVSEGNKLGKTYTGDMNVRGDVALDTGGWFGTRINTPIGKIAFTVRPAYFIPVVHIEKPTTSYSLVTNADGSVSVSGKVDIPIFTGVPGALLESGGDINGAVNGWLSSGGVDIAIAAEYPLLPILDVGARIKGLPLFPARMKYRSRIIAEFSMDADPILNDTDAVQSGDFMTNSSTREIYHDEKKLMVFRPFKIGVNAVYKPFRNNLLTLHPNLDLAVYNGVYADVGVKVQTNLANIFIFRLSSNLEDLVWKQRAGIILNARIIELEVSAGGQSQSFLRSFTGAGLNLMVGLRAGY